VPLPPSAPDTRVPAHAGASDAAASRFVLELARALQVHGTPAHRLEAALARVAVRLGLDAEFFSTPTSLMVGIGALDAQRVHLLRVDPGPPNLGHLAQLSAIARDVVDGVASPDEGLRRIRALLASPPRWPQWLVVFAFVCASTAVATFLRVRTGDVAVAALLGLITAAVSLFSSRREAWSHVTEPLAAFLVTTAALTVDTLTRSGTGYATSLAGLVVLLPGLMFTVALTELSTRHLASGTARLAGAIVVFLGLGFGLALGAKLGGAIGQLLHGATGDALSWLPATPLPPWAEWIALAVAPLAFTVLLNAERRDAGWILVTCIVAYLTSRLAGAAVGEELGAFLGAFVVSLGSNGIARLRGRTAMITSVPGLLILVPGSIGFRSVTSLLGDQVEVGIATAFRVALIGISLAAGILAGTLFADDGVHDARSRSDRP
jgi:uncharacterized membrane protein YjjP (DUF1212 family)